MRSATCVTLVLPGAPSRPSGGYFVALEHAVALSRAGFDVTVSFVDAARHWSVSRYVRAHLRRLRVPWIDLSSVRVQRRWSFPAQAADGVTIVTSWRTAELAARAGVDPAKVVYLLQGYETWSGSPARVADTFTHGFRVAAVSSWLAGLAADHGATEVEVVPNWVDRRVFFPAETPPDGRICGIWTPSPVKGGDTLLRVFDEVARRRPSVELSILTPPRANPPAVRHRLVPDATQQLVAATLRSHTGFVCASRSEGFGLPGLEALASGTSLISTDIPGIRDYASEETGWLAPVDDVFALADACLEVLDRAGERSRRRTAGLRVAAEFTKERSVSKMLEVVESCV